MSKKTKKPYGDVYPVAQEIAEKISPYCDRIEIAGSLRRKRETIGDIEIVALPKLAHMRNLLGDIVQTENMLHEFLVSNEVKLLKGSKSDAKQKQFTYAGYQVDLFLPTSPAHWGSIFTIRTGSHGFNMWVMNERCPKVKVRFSHGLVYWYGNPKPLETPEEINIFEALEMDFVPPKNRDDKKWMRYVR